MSKTVDEIYKKIDTYLGYYQSKKTTKKQTRAMLFTLMIEYDAISETKKVKDTKRICKEILNS